MIGLARSAITNPVDDSFPPWMGKLVVSAGESSVKANCHAVLVAKQPEPLASWALSTAHCFAGFTPEPGGKAGDAMGDAFLTEDVFFHPDAWQNPETEWLTLHPQHSELNRFDLVLIRLTGIEPGHEPIPLYHPADETVADAELAGLAVAFGGLTNCVDTDPDPVTENLACDPATGVETIVGIDGGMLIGARDVSGLQVGDSGGGAWRPLDGALPPSVPFPFQCAPTPGQSGAVLVGINQATLGPEGGDPVNDAWVPVYHTAIAQWIAKTVATDQDGDFDCDPDDNCPEVANPNQDNANELAENAWGSGKNLGKNIGDKCDQAVTPVPELEFGSFAPGEIESTITGTQYLFGKFAFLIINPQKGLEIKDQLTIRPVLDDGSDEDGVAAPLFCDCRNAADLSPIANPAACSDPAGPFKCILDPRQADDPEFVESAGGEASVEDKKTAWHPMSIEGADTYGLHYPGAAVTRPWHYEADYQKWVVDEGWMEPAIDAPGYPEGTDLGGGLWAHDTTDKGALEHGIECVFRTPDQICTIADGYTFGVAPDQKVVHNKYFKVAGENFTIDDFYVPLCPPFDCPPGDILGGGFAEPFVTAIRVGEATQATLWRSQQDPLDATARVSPILREAMLTPAALFVPASEPSTIGTDARVRERLGSPPPAIEGPDTPRALVLLPTEGGGVALHAVTVTDDDVFDLTLIEPLDPDVAPDFADLLVDDTERDFALVYSRTARALYLVRNGQLAMPDPEPRMVVREGILAPSGGWSRRRIDPHPPLGARAHGVFSPRDWRIWSLDRPEGDKHWRLRRIDPVSGRIETNKKLPALHKYDAVWLATYDDGRVLLVATRAAKPPKGKGKAKGGGAPATFVVALLSSRPFATDPELHVDGVFSGDGQVMTGAKVSRSVISLLVQADPSSAALVMDPLALRIGDLAGSWPALQDAFEAPDAP